MRAFGERGGKLSQFEERQHAMPFGARLPLVSLFVFPALLGGQAEHGEVRAVLLIGFDFSLFSDETD